MSYSGISFSGLSSGLDIESIVTRLMQLESVSLNRITQQQLILQNRQGLYSDMRTKLVSFNSTLSALSMPSTFTTVAGSSSNEAVATLSTDSSAQAGTYNLEVFKLAQAHKVSSSGQANSTDALGFEGEFMVNGKGVTVLATDNLSQIAGKINATDSGVTASIISGGPNSAYLTISAKDSGAKSAIQLSATSGTALTSLGFLTGAASAREAVDSDTVRSIGFTNATDTIASLTTSTKAGSFQIGASTINVDFATDSLQGIADKINLSGSGATATVVSVTENGKTKSKLEISGGGVPGSMTDTDGMLEGLGVLQRGYSSQILAAQDAEFKLDGFSLTSATNTVTSVIPGATITLLKANATDGEDTTLTFSQDTKGLKDKLKSLATSYNSVVSYIRQNSQFDTESFSSGALFGDSLAGQVEADLANTIFNTVGSGTIRSLADLGFTVDSDGALSFSEADFDKAFAADAAGVKGVLATSGSATGAGLSFVTSSSKTKSGSYAVNITQPATLSTLIGGTAQSAPNAGGEILSFSGQLFGSSTIALSVDSGTNLSDLITKINDDPRLKNLVSASDDGGKLKVESKRHGTSGGFNLVSNLAAGTDNSGVGTGSSSAYAAGLDIAGTINGEVATGAGQFLMGSAGNQNTDGLQIEYKGSTAGIIGNVMVTAGMSSILGSRISTFTDSVNGLITSADRSLTDQISDMTSRMDQISELLKLREQTLRSKFTAMEQAISRMQSQQNSMASILNQMSAG